MGFNSGFKGLNITYSHCRCCVWSNDNLGRSCLTVRLLDDRVFVKLFIRLRGAKCKQSFSIIWDTGRLPKTSLDVGLLVTSENIALNAIISKCYHIKT